MDTPSQGPHVWTVLLYLMLLAVGLATGYLTLHSQDSLAAIQIELTRTREGYETELATVRQQLAVCETQVLELKRSALQEGDRIQLEASNQDDSFLRHFGGNVQIGGTRNEHYEHDRTWILRRPAQEGKEPGRDAMTF